MQPYKRVSETMWEWREGSRQFSVRVFKSTCKLIWSSWIESANGPVYDDGVGQTFEAFLRGEGLPTTPPKPVLDEVTVLVQGVMGGKRTNALAWLQG